MAEAGYTLGQHAFRSRLIIGSGKYDSFQQNLDCAVASGAEMVTVALRRTRLDAPKGEGLLDFISPERFRILPNTAGCYTVDDAVSTARLGVNVSHAKGVFTGDVDDDGLVVAEEHVADADGADPPSMKGHLCFPGRLSGSVVPSIEPERPGASNGKAFVCARA